MKMTKFDKDYNYWQSKVNDYCQANHIDGELKFQIASIIYDRERILQGGHFAKAVNSNDLFEAVRRADTYNLRHIRDIIIALENI